MRGTTLTAVAIASILTWGGVASARETYSWDGEGGDLQWETAANWINTNTGVNDELPTADSHPAIAGKWGGSNPAGTVVLSSTQPDFFKFNIGHWGDSRGDLLIDGGQLIVNSTVTMRGGSSIEVKSGGVLEMSNDNGGNGGGTIGLRDTSRLTYGRKVSGPGWDYELHGSDLTFEHTVGYGNGPSGNQYFDVDNSDGQIWTWIADTGGISTITSTSAYRTELGEVHDAAIDFSLMSDPAGIHTLINAEHFHDDCYETLAREVFIGQFDSVNVTGLPSGFTYSMVYDEVNADVKLNVVPEPAATALLGLGGLGVLVRRRRRA